MWNSVIGDMADGASPLCCKNSLTEAKVQEHSSKCDQQWRGGSCGSSLSFQPQFYNFVSPMRVDRSDERRKLPAMSTDGGNEEEYEIYWAVNRRNRECEGWVEKMAHPQVNAETYWYHRSSGDIVWERPDVFRTGNERDCAVKESKIDGVGPVWEFSIKDLKAVMRSGDAEDYGLRTEDLARRACAEFENFVPRVLSWHDYQYVCFWFFGGMDNKDEHGGRGSSNSFFSSGGNDKLFASKAFFDAAETVLLERMETERMHPINLTYFIWTFTRAGYAKPKLMQSVGDFLCDKGLIPMFDRCSLGTMVWNFSKMGVRHDRFFEASALEACRPNRVRSLAPRNYQNIMIAFSRQRHWNEKLVDAMARGTRRLLDSHDPQQPKTDKSVLFSYVCRDGSEVPADAFRITSCTVVAKAFREMRAYGEVVERMMASMLDYTVRSVERSPAMMREPGDACGFLKQLALVVEAGILDVGHLVSGANFSELCAGAPERELQQLRQVLRRVGQDPFF